MIVRMSKIEIAGPKEYLQNVLSLIRSLGIFQIEPSTIGFVEKGLEEELSSPSLDKKTLFERLFLEDLREKIDLLFSFLPKMPVRKSYLTPQSIIGTVSHMVERHIAACRTMVEKRGALHQELAELREYAAFLESIVSLFRDTKRAPDIDVIGLTIKDANAVGEIEALLSTITDGKYKLFTAPSEDGTLGGLITVEKTLSGKVSAALSSAQIPEKPFPETFDLLSLVGKIDYLRKRSVEIASEIESIALDMEKICLRWRPIYSSIRDWIDEQLALLSSTALVFQTKMCFFINGWMPSANIEGLRKSLISSFGTQIVVEEQQMLEEDLDRVPVMIENPAYFRPFELFIRLLPLPRYSSFDPTPFIGIFFPVFFGMILGDAGYGLFLLAAAIIVKKRTVQQAIRDGSQILLISSLYTIFFGILYGEFFGDLPHRVFGIEPICIERRTAVIPMLYFTLTVGVLHIFLGLVLGTITAFRKKTKKEALFKILSMLIIICLIIVLASFFDVFPAIVAQPLIVAILIIAPLLLFAGGLLAPLELMKSIGNIISYVRIMAIGLTSVLLAFIANHLGGITGNIVLGIFVAGMLHLLNIILGVFSPTIHSLRLHYVEFFSKFLEQGGREFEPFKKRPGER